MKVLLISQCPPPSGGIATWTKVYLNYMKNRADMAITVVNCALKGGRARNFNAKRNILAELWRTFGIAFQILAKSIKCKPDVIHLNSSCSPMGIIRDWLCVKLLPKHIPLILHCHCSIANQLGNNQRGIEFFKRVASRAQTILVLNSDSQKWVSDVCEKKSEIIPNFIDDSEVVQKPHTIVGPINKVVYIGHLLETKGINEMMTIARKFPQIDFVFAGSYTEDVEIILQAPNVKLLGDVAHDQVISLLDDADLFLFLSYTEGFSISLLEAMARGVPVVASDVGANRDMVEEFGGIIVPARDAEASICGFNQMLKLAEKERREMSDWEIKKVNEQYTTNSVLNKVIDIYQKVFAERK